MVMLNMNDELESESLSWEESYFELEFGPSDDAHDFEFRLSISTVVPHAAAAAAAPIIDLTPTHLITTTTTTTTCRKTVGGKINRSMMMKLLVKLRSIINTRPFDRLFGQRSFHDQLQRSSRRNNMFGIGRSPASASASASMIPSPLPQLAHHSSLLHAAIAHCNKSNSFSFSL